MTTASSHLITSWAMHSSQLKKLEVLNYYSNKFQRIRVDWAHGFAPHKPILLLSVMEMFERGTIQENRINLSTDLNQIFLKYWSYLGSASHNPDISRPYFHMKSGKFWHLVAKPGFEKILSAKIKLKTLAEVKRAIAYAYIDEDLYDFFNDELCRDNLQAVLVSRWFPGRLIEIKEISQTDSFQNPSNSFREAYETYARKLQEES